MTPFDTGPILPPAPAGAVEILHDREYRIEAFRLAADGTGGTMAAIGGLSSVEGDSYRFRQFGARATDGYHVRVVDNVDDNDDNVRAQDD